MPQEQETNLRRDGIAIPPALLWSALLTIVAVLLFTLKFGFWAGDMLTKMNANQETLALRTATGQEAIKTQIDTVLAEQIKRLNERVTDTTDQLNDRIDATNEAFDKELAARKERRDAEQAQMTDRTDALSDRIDTVLQNTDLRLRPLENASAYSNQTLTDIKNQVAGIIQRLDQGDKPSATGAR